MLRNAGGCSLTPRSPVFPACSSARRAKYSPGRPRRSVSLRSPQSPLASPKPAGEGVGRRAPHYLPLPSVSSQKWMAQPRAGKDAGRGEQRSQGTPGPSSPPRKRRGGNGDRKGDPTAGIGRGGKGEEKRGVAAPRLLSSSTVVLKCAPTLPLARPLARPPPAAQPL